MIDENNLIYKKNLMIESIYDFTALELKLTLIAISKISKTDDKFFKTILNIDEISKIINTDKNCLYNYVKKICCNLGSKTLKIYDKSKHEYTIYPWFSKLSYKNNSGTIELEFNDKINPFLLLIKNNFTAYELKNIINMNSKHSIRLYELLKQYEKIGYRKLDINDFKKILVLKNSYYAYSNIKLRVLEPAKKEIEKYSDIKFDYIEIKKGRKVIGLNFNINNNSDLKDYEKFSKFKIINLIQNIYFEKFERNIMHIKLTNKHRILLIDIYKRLLGVAPNKIKYPERWFNSLLVDAIKNYDLNKLKELKDY